ncbi:hypothetical protein JCM30237_17010 [Halolamina litorea]|uniref:histidine kinase n=1 Tax=Halolamina litorea TaxID=1515593 RepID=A0ABD6BQZ6_9EURY|nr:PAS domain-containing sensor histidine kinase [Halolamina litorea]
MTSPLPTGITTAGVDALPVEIAILDAEGTITLVNEAWRRFADENHGTHGRYWMGENYLEICRRAHADPLAAAAVEGIEAALGGDDGPFRLEYPCHSPDEHRWYAMEVSGFDADGSRYAVVAHINITERKLAELRSTARERQLETLLTVLTHDIRNPLNVIEGYADLLATDLDHADEAARIRRAALRIAEITEATLSFSQSGALSTVSPVRIEEVAREAWTRVDDAAASLTVVNPPTIHGDRRLLIQLFERLFQNSVEHGSTGPRTAHGDNTEPGGTNGEAPPDPDAGGDPAITVGSLPDGFYVEDDGPGIPEEIREVAVVADFSTRGTDGLGLAIVQSIVQAHGGTLTITDAVGGGARFEIRGIDVAPV